MSDKFNPAEYLRTLPKRRKIKDPKTGQEKWVEESHLYLDVKYRVLWYRHIYPEGYIETTECEVTDKFARIEAVVYDRDPNDGGKRLGKGRRQVNALDFRDYTEKAETQAIGRALAVAGFGTQFCDDLDEENILADSPVNAPQQKQLPSKPSDTSDNTSTLSPGNAYSAASQKGLTKEDTDILIQLKYQRSNASQLTPIETEEFIQGLQDTPKQRLQEFITKVKASIEGQGNEDPEKVA